MDRRGRAIAEDSAAPMPRGAHLIGSVPMASADAVFRTMAGSLGDRLRRIPDGETGERALFAGWQVKTFAQHPDFEPVPGRRLMEVVKPRRLRAGVDPTSVHFPQLGFAEAARESYEVFKRLRSDGIIRPGVRFQVSLPTPVNCLAMVVDKRDIPAVEGHYEAAMLSEVDAIADHVPPTDLALQWDCPWEVRVWDGNLPAFLVQPWFGDARAGLLDRLLRLGARVPEGAELGYHLCHGDYEHTGNLILGIGAGAMSRVLRSTAARLLREFSIRVAGPPRDARSVTELANALVERTSRPINFIQLPAPRAARSEYFAPLSGLRLQPDVELYIGLVHFTDGLKGTRRRIESAQKVVREFGVSTECGWGRRDPQTIPGLIDLHRQVSLPIGDDR
ncbi:MAG TPA: hypothetical protein VE953_18315 [Terriglobales bacterium]|nr:hypothetical protein [Terriglobales bacterium]